MFDGAITNTSDGTNIGEQQVLLPKGLNKERFTLACRAFKPTQLKFFDPADYAGAGALNSTPNLPSTGSVTTALTAFILYQFGTGPVRGFAVALLAGLAASLVSAIFVVRTLFYVWISRARSNQALSI